MVLDPVPFSHPWSEMTIGEVSLVEVGGTPSTSVPAYWINGTIPWMSSGDVHQRRIMEVPEKITEKGLLSSNAKVIEPPAVAIALAGQGKTRGTAGLVLTALCTNQSVALVKPDSDNLDVTYLFYNLEFRYEELRARSSGGGRAGLTKAIIESIPIPVPPLPEQRRIAAILDAADEAIRATERVIAKLRQIKAGLLHDLLTRGLDAQGRLRDPVAYLAHCHPEERSDEGSRFPRTGHLASLGMTDCGWRDLSRSWGMECKYPSDWLVLSLAEVTAKFIGGGTPSTSVPEYWDGTIPWITGADAEQKIATTSRKYVTERGIKESSTCIVPEGNILLVTRTGVGKVSIAGVDIAISQDLTGVVLDREVIDASYLYRQLKYLGRELQRLSQGTIIQGIKREEVKELPIPVPPLAEQRRIAAILDAHDARLRAEEAALAKLRQVKRGLMDDLLTGKVRV